MGSRAGWKLSEGYSFVSNYEIFVQEGVCGRELALWTAAEFMEPLFSLRKRQAEALLIAIGDAQSGRL